MLDVRRPEDFEEAHLPGAVNLSQGKIEPRLSEVETPTGGDKSKPIVTYRRSGTRAGKARKMLGTQTSPTAVE